MRLNKYNNKNYQPGNFFKRSLWYSMNRLFFNTCFPWPSNIKSFILKIFGAKIGKKLIIKPKVNIKYPWFLEIGDYCWIGEKVWIDNLDLVKIGNNVCISQGAYLCTGNHDFKKESFDLVTKPITIKNSVWIAAKTVVCPGVVLEPGSVLTAGSVLTKNTESNVVYQGNPAKKT